MRIVFQLGGDRDGWCAWLSCTSESHRKSGRSRLVQLDLGRAFV